MSLFLTLLLSFAQNPAPNPPVPPPSPLQQAGQFLRQGQNDQAIAVLEPLVEAEPTNAAAWYWLGFCYHANRDWPKAIPAHEKAAGFPQTAANASYNLACAWALQADADKAFEWLGKARTAGFSAWGQLWSDADLSSLRADPRFENFAPPPPDFDNPFVEPTNVLFAWHGENANDQFGWVASDAGDIDGDGIHDVITSAPFLKLPTSPKTPAGRVYLYSGRTGKELRRHTGQPFDTLGLAVAGVGDLDGDGFGDYAATAPRTSDLKRPGGVLVWSGASGKLLFEMKGEKVGDGFGREVRGMFDCNRDGVTDLLVGSPLANGGAGMVSGHSGKDGSLLWSKNGSGANDSFGSTVSSGRNTGGILDEAEGTAPLMVVGAMNAGAGQRGQVIVYRYVNRNMGIVEHFRVEAEANNVNYGRFFSSVIGDLNGDKVDDIYSVDFESNTGGAGSGQIRLHSGVDGKLLWKRDGAAGEGLGIGNAIAGDANGDGFDDVITGAWTNSNGAPSGGRCYLLSGIDGAVLRTWTCNLANATMGFDSTSLPDCNADGQRDFLFTAAWTSVQGPQTGSVYLVAADAVESTGEEARAESDSR